jgi:hypothetical protein
MRQSETPSVLRLACATMLAGLLISSLSRIELKAQTQQPNAESPARQGAPATDENKPAASKPGGTRPTTPAPEPARPNSEAKEQGAKAALPDAPAEKIAPPMRDK